jgi:hypothetical protein
VACGEDFKDTGSPIKTFGDDGVYTGIMVFTGDDESAVIAIQATKTSAFSAPLREHHQQNSCQGARCAKGFVV